MANFAGRSLRPESATLAGDEDEDDIDVPDEVEGILEDLLKALQDKVSISPNIVWLTQSTNYRIPSSVILQPKQLHVSRNVFLQISLNKY